jgi:hypothetical protein
MENVALPGTVSKELSIIHFSSSYVANRELRLTRLNPAIIEYC